MPLRARQMRLQRRATLITAAFLLLFRCAIRYAAATPPCRCRHMPCCHYFAHDMLPRDACHAMLLPPAATCRYAACCERAMQCLQAQPRTYAAMPYCHC